MGAFTGNDRKSFDINLSFCDLSEEKDFFDVTLAADSSDGSIQVFQAHKLILSACSPVLRSLLRKQSLLNVHSQVMPVMLYLRGLSARGLNNVLEFVYKGNISLAQDDLNDFLSVGESLQIPLLERPEPALAKRAAIQKKGEKSKRVKMVLPESDLPSLQDNSLSGIVNKSVTSKRGKVVPPESNHSSFMDIPMSGDRDVIKEDPGFNESSAPSEDMYGGYPREDMFIEDISQEDANLGEDDNGEEVTDEVMKNGSADFEGFSVDELMQSKVQVTGDGFTCTICGSCIKYSYTMKRHMQNIHLSSAKDYYCPSCNKYFKNRGQIYNHVYYIHKEWMKGFSKGKPSICYDNFASKSFKSTEY